jgi:hypothetical protein
MVQTIHVSKVRMVHRLTLQIHVARGWTDLTTMTWDRLSGLDMSQAASEAMLLESVLPDLEVEGLEVFAHPSPPILPAFMRDYSPDAIALRSDKKLAIEVLREGAPSDRRLSRLRELFSEHKDWELRVYLVSPSNVRRAIDGVSRDVIEQSIKATEELAIAGRTNPLFSWRGQHSKRSAALFCLTDCRDRKLGPAH